MNPLLEHANYNDARRMLNERGVTGDDVRAWFAEWCKGKTCFKMSDGRPWELVLPMPGVDEFWVPIHWIENA